MKKLVLFVFLAGCSNAVTNALPDFSIFADAAVALTDGASAPTDGGKATGGDLVVNEVNPNGTDVVKDPDWIELYNPTSMSIDLSAYTIADSNTTNALPATTMDPGTYLLILCDDGPDGGSTSGIHEPFKLGSADEVHLKKNGNGVDKTSWAKGDVPDGKTWARIPNATGPFQAATPTALAPNMP